VEKAVHALKRVAAEKARWRYAGRRPKDIVENAEVARRSVVVVEHGFASLQWRAFWRMETICYG
jgi:hypothetical protein